MTSLRPNSNIDSSDTARLPIVEGVRVDLAAIASISHQCRPDRCDATEFCCAHYEVCVTAAEMETIVGYMPMAAEHARHLRTQNGYRNVFDEIDADLLTLDTDDRDLCLFAYRSRDGTLCSLHTVAAAIGRVPVDVKPKACSLWPLAVRDTNPVILSVQADAARFPCNRFRKKPARKLDAGIEEILAMVFGLRFLERVRQALSQWF